MSRGRIIPMVFLGLLFTLPPGTIHVAADSTAGPYQGIVERNVFGLKPPPPVDTAPALPPAPPAKLTLTGITTILGSKRALLSAQIPNKPPESYILSVGQRDGDVEVLGIDEKEGSVKVNNQGTVQTLTFLNDGAKVQAAPLLPTGEGGIPIASRLPPPPTAAPPVKLFPTRTMRLPNPPAPPPAPPAPASNRPR